MAGASRPNVRTLGLARGRCAPPSNPRSGRPEAARWTRTTGLVVAGSTPARRVASTPARVNGFAVLRYAPALRVTRTGAPASWPGTAGRKPAGLGSDRDPEDRALMVQAVRPVRRRTSPVHPPGEGAARTGRPRRRASSPQSARTAPQSKPCRRTRSQLWSPPCHRSRQSAAPARRLARRRRPGARRRDRAMRRRSRCSVRAWPSRQGTISPGATRAIGVPQERPLRRETGGFVGVAPGTTGGAIPGRPRLPWEAIGSVNAGRSGPAARPARGDSGCDRGTLSESHAGAAHCVLDSRQ